VCDFFKKIFFLLILNALWLRKPEKAGHRPKSLL